jgi:hypothetical protein
MDRTLTHKPHLEKTAKKTGACVNLIRKLARTNWGSDAQTLRTASLFFGLTYCLLAVQCVILTGSTIQLNNALHLFSRILKSTQLPWLSVLTNIAPPKLRRETTAVHELANCRRHAKSFLFEELQNLPTQRSQKLIWKIDGTKLNYVVRNCWPHL